MCDKIMGFMMFCIGISIIMISVSGSYLFIVAASQLKQENQQNQQTQQQEHPCKDNEVEEPCLDCDEKEKAGLELEEALQMYPLPTPDPNMNTNNKNKEKKLPTLAPPKLEPMPPPEPRE